MKHRVIDPAGAFFGLVIPVLCALGGVALTKIWEPRLPEKIATHWSMTSADGFAAPITSAWTFALLTILFGGGLSAIAALAPAMLMMRRFMIVVGLIVVGLITGGQFASLHAQLDVADPSSVPAPIGALAAGALGGCVVGLLGASLLRDYRPRTAATEAPNRALPRSDASLPITDDVGFSTQGSVIFGLIMATPGIILGLISSTWFLALFLVLAVFCVTLVRFRVVVDATEIKVFNMGMPAMTYGVDEVVGAKVAEIKPFADFGGWGLKSKGRRNYGIVTRTGPAVVITFAGGDKLTITTPKADDIAGALNSLADARIG
ncbi:DUF1648 domain-containing protein [Rhodococcus sp. 24CO]|uniref:DUF1648 domain-containing protein n=1 Tax=Rhodococcus sp. 24CO TaxID=3117460 RepID=UPI003D3465C3